MPQRQIGPFLLEQQIGVGGMGVVYSATYPQNNRKVAVKILSPALMADPKLLRRFEREVKILKRLDHPNIVKCYGGGTVNNQRYYAMQFIDGGSLQDVLKKRGKLSWEQVIHVGRQVCSALEHAHNAGIVHRDLKPANLFLSRKGRLMLGDFGIARDTEATALTAAGKTVGTYAYMAPEQINGSHPISGKTDLYALGCVLYEILVGEPPFVGDNPADMLMQHLQDDPHDVSEFAPDCPIWLDKLIDRMLAKNPDDRPFDALAVHTELGEIRQRISEGNSVAAVSMKPAGRISTRDDDQQLKKALRKNKKKKRKKVPFHEQAWFLATCLLALVGITVWLILPPSIASLHAKAQAAMESGDYSKRREALDEYILPALERDPDQSRASDFRIWADHVRLEILERQMSKKVKGFGRIESQFEAVYKDTRQMEQDLDVNPLAAIERYHQFISSEDAERPEGMTEDEQRIWSLLFNRRLDESKASLLSDDRVREHFRARMETAEQFFAEGDVRQAMMIWDTTARVFKNVDTVKDFQSYARMRRLRKRAEIPPIG